MGNRSSEPFLIYPSRKDVDTYGRSAPGRLAFIPNEPGRFEIARVSGLHDEKTKVAEIFTAILSDQLIAGLELLRADEQYRQLDPAVAERFEREWGTETWRFDMQGSAGRPITDSERLAGKSAGEPLTDADPPPQTVYHVVRKSDSPILFTMTVPIRK